MAPDLNRRLQTLIWIGILAAMVWLLFELSPILTPFLLAAILAYICDPLVERMENLGVPRTAGTAVTILLLVALLVLLVLILVPLVTRERRCSAPSCRATSPPFKNGSHPGCNSASG